MTQPPGARAPKKFIARDARAVAARVVYKVLSEGAFVSDTLDAELFHLRLEPRERALATELSYGVVRLHKTLAERVDALTKRGAARGDPLAQAHLWIAAYQLLVLDRIPAFAAINEAVSTLRKLRGARVANFANAILRKLSSEPKLDRAQAYRKSVPSWLFEQLVGSVGETEALALLGAQAPEGLEEQLSGCSVHRGLCVRLTEKYRRDAPSALPWLERTLPGQLQCGGLWLPAVGDLRKLPGFAEGWFAGQEEGAQWSALALGAKPGDRVLDACAGHGQKSTLLAEQIGSEGQLWATDIRDSKLRQLRAEFERLSLTTPQTQVVDWSASTEPLPEQMDRVLVDVPCTGTGTLRRRPEIALRLAETDVARFAERSCSILRAAARCARPGGRIVFVVCSVLRAECESVVEAVADVLTPVPFDSPLAQGIAGEAATQVRLLPSVHGTDGYFVASFAPRG